MIICKLGEQSCYSDGQCHYTKHCDNQIVIPDNPESTTVSVWKFNERNSCWVCGSCGTAALNDHNGRSTPSAFCPHCGKPMTISNNVIK